MRRLIASVVLLTLAGCGGGTQKHEVTIKTRPSAESAAVQEHVTFDNDIYDKLLAEAGALPERDPDRGYAILRLQSIQNEFMRRVKLLDTKAAAEDRRKQLEGKTVADLAKDYWEHLPNPPKK